MKLLKSNVEIQKQEPGLEGLYKQIEQVGRACYASEDLRTPDSAKPFVDRLVKSGHGKVLEHGTVYLRMNNASRINDWETVLSFLNNPYTHLKLKDEEETYYITTNYRVLVENNLLGVLDTEYYCPEPYPEHYQRVCFKFNCDRGVSAEANRHTVNSAMERSTRYCNFSKSKFGNEISIIQPEEVNTESALFFDELCQQTSMFRKMCGAIYGTSGTTKEEISETLTTNGWTDVDYWLFSNLAAEFSYFSLLAQGWKPQAARRVLPLDLHTVLYHTAYVSDWKRFINQRSAPVAHPDIKVLSDKLHDLLVQNNLL